MTAPNPDLPPAVDLTLHDVDEQDLYDAMEAAIRVRLPQWVAAEGDIETMLMQTWALATGQLIYTVNQIPSRLLDAIVAIFGLTRHEATKATGTINVTMASVLTGSKTVPAGAVFRVQVDPDTAYDVEALAPVVGNPADGLTFPVPVTAVVAGPALNGVPVGTEVTLIDSLSWVERATVGVTFVGGTDPEDDAPYYQRAASFLRRRTLTLVIAQHFADAALEQDGVGRAKAFDLWDGTGATPGTVHGHISVAVATPAGGAVASDVRTAVLNRLTAGAQADLTIHILDPVVVAQTVTATVSVGGGFDPAATRAAAAAAVRAYLDPAQRPWGAALSAFDIAGVLYTVPGITGVSAVGGSAITSSVNRLMLPAANATVTIT